MVFLALMAQARDPVAMSIGFSAVAGVGSLVAGVQAALMFAPADEPALELLLASPRPAAYLLLERLIIVVGLNTLVAVLGAVFFTRLFPTDTFVDQLVRWFAPMIAMTGLGMWISIITRRSNYGMLIVILFSGAMLFGGAYVLIELFELGWLIVMYPPLDVLTPDHYLINRVFLTAFGLVLIALTFWHIREPEHLIGAAHTAV